MQAIEIPLSELISSSLNPRSSVETTFRAQLKTSITASGLRDPLKVRKNGKGYIVLDGNTRLSVLQETANDNDLIPCIVLEEKEQTDDTEYALLVNQIRRPIDPWDECSAYNAMIVSLSFNLAQSRRLLISTMSFIQTVRLNISKKKKVFGRQSIHSVLIIIGSTGKHSTLMNRTSKINTRSILMSFKSIPMIRWKCACVWADINLIAIPHRRQTHLFVNTQAYC
jgi:hypothetical protein